MPTLSSSEPISPAFAIVMAVLALTFVMVTGWTLWQCGSEQARLVGVPRLGVPISDATARLACREVTRLLEDTRLGLVAQAEFAARAKRIHEEYGRTIDRAVAPDVADQVRALAVAVTTGTSHDIVAASAALDTACRRFR